MFTIVSLKWIEANGEPLPRGPERWRVLWRRWLLDRDIDDWDAWTSRRPQGSAPSWRMAAPEGDSGQGARDEDGDRPQAG